jgi:anaerobic dimethyl sulfoxide reductase subunit B (iron-sulfur subunit)
MTDRFAFYFDPVRCLKCRACEIACQQWKGIKAGTIKLRKIVEVSAGTFPDFTRKFLSISCHHCTDAPCAAACPVGAISQKDNGIVFVNKEQCTACHSCFEACAFGIPQFDEEEIMYKCDMCLDRLEKGQRPICAEACPTQALQWISSTDRESG